MKGGAEEMAKGKTPEYTKRAIEKYNEKFDKVLIRIPAGHADMIRNKIGMSCNAYFNQLMRDDFAARGIPYGTGTEEQAENSGKSGDIFELPFL